MLKQRIVWNIIQIGIRKPTKRKNERKKEEQRANKNMHASKKEDDLYLREETNKMRLLTKQQRTTEVMMYNMVYATQTCLSIKPIAIVAIR